MVKISDYVVDYLSSQNITHGYFIIGGAIGYIVDSCAKKNFPLYTMHHEQAAAFAAEGQAAVTRNLGLAMATSGPGATNLITGIASAYFASHPVIFITGQVNTYESNLTGKRRQVGFQETDIVAIVKSITKYAVKITEAKDIAYHLEKAIFLSKHDRMGPVLIDLPFNIQRSEVEPSKLKHFIARETKKLMNKISEVAKSIETAKRPIILIGHGVKLSNAENSVLELIEKTNIPFVTSLLGMDIIPNNHKLCYGFIGTYGHRSSNLALANSDLIIVLGARLDSRQVGVMKDKFAPIAKIIHVDIDKNELGTSVKEYLSFNADIKDFINNLLPLVKRTDNSEWINFLQWLTKNYSHVKQKTKDSGVDPLLFINEISDVLEEGAIISVDVGSHQMWFAQSWKVKKDQIILTNGGMGPMGCALPTAIGACIASKQKPTLVISGDGGFQVNIHELQTVVRNKLPIKIVILNNKVLGMLTQFQSENFEGRTIGSIQGYDTPDFVEVAKAYKIPAKRIETNADIKSMITWLKNQNGACLLDVKVPKDYWVFPKSSYARPVHDMRPFLSDVELKKALKFVGSGRYQYTNEKPSHE